MRRIEAGITIAIVALLMMACSSQTQTPKSDMGQPPPALGEPREANGGGQSTLRTNEIRTRHLMPGVVTAGKLAIKATTVTVAGAATTGSSAADTDLAGGFLVACTPAGNQDQLMDNAVLNGDGSITITLGAAATGVNTFRCTALKPDAKGVS